MTDSVAHRPAALLLAEEVWGTTLHAMRSLAGRGAEVFVAVAGRGASIYRSSTVCSAAVDIPADCPQEYCRSVVEWADRAIANPRRPVIVIPLSDRIVDHLNTHRGSFPDRYRLGIPAPEVIEPLLDKRSALRIAERAGLDVPRWVAIGADGDVEPKIEDPAIGSTGPVAVRPARWTTPGPGYFKVVVTEEQAELDRLTADSVTRDVPLVAQEYVDAPDHAVEFGILWRSRDRSMTVVSTGRKRRQSAPEGGVMVWGEAAELPEVRTATERFLDESGFTGLGGVEFIRTRDTLRFIEFNPRLEAIHFLATAAGIDTVAIAYEELAGAGIPGQVPTQHEAGAWLGSAWLERMRVDPGYRWRTFADRRAFSRLPVRARAIWSWDDPQPGLRVFRRLTDRVVRSAVSNVRHGRGKP